MMRRIFCQTVVLLLLTMSAMAQTMVYDREVSREAQGRIGASLEVPVARWFKVGVGQELRMKSNFTEFDRSSTELDLIFKPVRHLKLEADYMFLASYKQKKNEWVLRHRLNLIVGGYYSVGRWKMSLRERFQVTFRPDTTQYNTQEKIYPSMYLRTRFKVEYKCFSKPLKPYASVEMFNPLTQTQYTSMWIDEMQYRIGLEWRLSKSSTLDFFYMFDHGFGKDVDIKAKKNKVVITDDIEYNHIIGIFYNYCF